MTDAPITLKAFFSDDPTRPIAEGLDADALTKTALDAAGDLPRVAVQGFRGAFAGALDGLFEPRLEDILQRSWGKVAAVQEAMKATLDDAEGLAVVPLLDHRITSNHAPHIDLVIGDQKLCRLEFAIALALELRGVQLEIRRGAICALTAGACLGDGTFGLAGQTLLKRATPVFDLPGRLTFLPEAPAPQFPSSAPHA